MTAALTPAQLKRLTRAVQTAAGYALLPAAYSWGQGGCWIFAAALQRVIGGELLVVTFNYRPQHVLVAAYDRLIDVDQVAPTAKFLRYWYKEARGQGCDPTDLRLTPILALHYPLAASGIPFDSHAVAGATQLFRHALARILK
jgi:hypothetical protein